MRKSSLIAALGIFCALTCVGSFVAGVREGAEQSELLQSTVRASLLASELRVLREVKAERLVQAKEVELDGQVLLYARFLKEGHPGLLWPSSSQFEHERYLRNVAAYRKQFPAVLPSLPVTGTGELSEEMRNNAMLVARTTDAIIREYGK